MSIDTINDLPPRVQYIASASQTEFPYPFPIFQDADLVVEVNGGDQVLDTDYTVDGEGEDTGGNVTFTTGLTAGDIVTIYRETVIERDSDFQLNGPMFSTSVNDEFDKLIVISQELRAAVRRCLRIPNSAEVDDADIELSPISNWYNKYLAFDSTGKPEPAELVTGTISQSIIAGLLFPQSVAEAAEAIDPPNKQFQYGHLYRYGTNTTPGTTDMTAALQAALDCNKVVYLPDALISLTNVTIPVGRTIIGQGPRNSVLRQPTGTTGYAFEFEDANSADISEGAFRFDGFGLHVATTSDGVRIGAVNASMFLSDNFRLVSRQAESLVSAPYATTTNQRGFYIDSDGTGSIFFAHHRNLEIRSFDIAIDADTTINEWTVHGWLIDCRIGVRLTGCSTWDLSGVTVESAVSGARALQTFGAVSNVKWIGGRWELTRPTSESGGCYGVEGDGSTTGANWKFSGINVLINGDGSALPGRKWTGTLPNDFIFEGTDTAGSFIIIPNLVALRLPNLLLVGGQGVGNGKITFGRNSNSTALSFIEHDGTHFVITGGNSVKLRGDGTSNDRVIVDGTRVQFPSPGAVSSANYQSAIALGASGFLWVDTAGKLRIKSSAPTSDGDGTIVGTQT